MDTTLVRYSRIRVHQDTAKIRSWFVLIYILLSATIARKAEPTYIHLSMRIKHLDVVTLSGQLSWLCDVMCRNSEHCGPSPVEQQQ